jgi:hypothetical protein
MGSSDVFEGKKLIRAFEFDQVDRPELSWAELCDKD